MVYSFTLYPSVVFCIHKAMWSSLVSTSELFVTLKRNSIPLGSHSFFSYACFLPRPRKPIMCLLSVWSCLLWRLHMNGILQYLTFLSLASFTYNHIFKIYPCLHMCQNFISWTNYTSLYGYTTFCLSICQLIDPTFGSLWISLLCTCMFIFLSGCMLLFLLNINLGIEVLSHRATMFAFFFF